MREHDRSDAVIAEYASAFRESLRHFLLKPYPVFDPSTMASRFILDRFSHFWSERIRGIKRIMQKGVFR
jgi:hypothetical protein